MSYTGQPRLWVLLADGMRARVVTPEAHHGRWITVLDLGSAEHPHKLNKRQYLEGIAARLSREADKGSFEKLLLAGTGHALHDIELALSKSATARLTGTLSKDLTKVADHELTHHLADYWMGLPKPD